MNNRDLNLLLPPNNSYPITAPDLAKKYDDAWLAAEKKYGCRPVKETEEKIANRIYDLPAYSITQPIINFHVNMQVTNIIDQHTLAVQNRNDIRRFVLSRLNVTTGPIDIFSATLSPIEGSVEVFCNMINEAIKRGCKIRIVLAKTNGEIFTKLNKDPKAAERISMITKGLKNSIGDRLEICYYDEVFYNAIYHFGDMILFNSFVPENPSVLVSANVQSIQNNREFFRTYEKQFEDVLKSPKTSNSL